MIKLYNLLLKTYNPQGWWPLLSCEGVNPTKTGAVNGYHPNDYSFPKNDLERFEICIGAILTQNTAWPNVEKALQRLNRVRGISASGILQLGEEELKNAIRPAGYYNQKAKKLKIFAEFYLELKGRTPTREELLDLWGVGPETADSMLLYAYHEPAFVVDAYTKRIFARLGIIKEGEEYEEIQKRFHKSLEKDHKMYNEYHALIVEHAKRSCKTKPECGGCVLGKICKKIILK